MQEPNAAITAADITAAEKTRILDQILTDRNYELHKGELTLLARDSDAAVRERSIELFWKLTDPDFTELEASLIELDLDFIDILLDAAGSDPVPEVRTEAIRALGRYIYEGFRMENLDEADYKRIKGFLLKLHQDPESPLEFRRASIEALGYITDPEIEQLIREAYSESLPGMKVSALFAMGRSGMDTTWDDLILRALVLADSDVRFEAVRAAGETYLSRAAEIMERLVDDPERRIRLEAIRALGNTGRASSRSLLLRLTSSPDEDVRDAATDALTGLDYFKSEPLLDE